MMGPCLCGDPLCPSCGDPAGERVLAALASAQAVLAGYRACIAAILRVVDSEGWEGLSVSEVRERVLALTLLAPQLDHPLFDTDLRPGLLTRVIHELQGEDADLREEGE